MAIALQRARDALEQELAAPSVALLIYLDCHYADKAPFEPSTGRLPTGSDTGA